MASANPDVARAILRNARAAWREQLRNKVLAEHGPLPEAEIERRVDQLVSEARSAAGRKAGAVTRQRLAAVRRFEDMRAELVERTEGLLDLLRSVDEPNPETCDHDWPAELNSEAYCPKCSLRYDEFSESAVAA